MGHNWNFSKFFLSYKKADSYLDSIIENGKEISKLVDSILNPGTYEVEWDGSNFASGSYFYKLESSGFSDTKTLILLK